MVPDRPQELGMEIHMEIDIAVEAMAKVERGSLESDLLG